MDYGMEIPQKTIVWINLFEIVFKNMDFSTVKNI